MVVCENSANHFPVENCLPGREERILIAWSTVVSIRHIGLILNFVFSFSMLGLYLPVNFPFVVCLKNRYCSSLMLSFLYSSGRILCWFDKGFFKSLEF